MLSLDARPPLRQLEPADLAAIADLQRAVLAACPANFLRERSETELAAYLDGTLGAAYGIAKHGVLAAAALLTLPNPAEPGESMAEGIAKRGVVVAAGLREHIGEGDWMRVTSFLGNAMVRREARGRGYQRALIAARLAHAAAANMRWAFSGVHLGNAASWRNLLAQGMAIVVARADPRHPMLGLIRAVGAPALMSDSSDRRSVAAHEPSQHQAALLRGYIGKWIADGVVVYEKLVPAQPRANMRSAGAEVRQDLAR